MKVNKIYSLSIMFAMLFSCSNEAQFNEKKHEEIWTDEISSVIRKDTLYLESISLKEQEEYLSDFFWIIDSDTTRNRNARKKISYGWHFFELFLIDIWSDTSSYRDSIFYKEPFSFTLLSPINNYSVFSGDSVKFQYKLNGLSEKDEVVFLVLVYKENYPEKDSWVYLHSNSLELSCLKHRSVYWMVEAYINGNDEEIISSEARRIICLEE